MKEKLIVNANCRQDGAHVAKGTIIEADLNDKKDVARLSGLNSAGRLSKALPEVVAAIKAEIAAEEKLAKALDAKAMPGKE